MLPLQENLSICLPRNINRENVAHEELGLSEMHIRISGKSLAVERSNPSQDMLRFQAFLDLLRKCNLPANFDCNFILNMYEGIYDDRKTSRLAYTAQPNSHHILIPDAHCFAAREKVEWVLEHDIPFAEKKKSAVFAGSDTGARHSDGWTMRSLVAATYKDSSTINAKLTFLDADTEKRLRGKVSVEEIYSQPLSLVQQIKHQVILNINGNSTSWERLLWAMASNSLCVFVKPFDGEEMYSWYYPIMESLGLAVYVEYDRLEEFIAANDFSNKFWQQKIAAQKEFAEWASNLSTCRKVLENALVAISKS